LCVALIYAWPGPVFEGNGTLHAMSSNVLEPVFKPIELEVEIERRRARVLIPGLLEATGRPIRSPATGDEHRVRIGIPNGVEFEIAEIGSATTKATGPIPLDLDDTYGQFRADFRLVGRSSRSGGTSRARLAA
jgi:hypothetical protein